MNQTHAQRMILKAIKIKSNEYHEHIDYDAYEDYNDCHGDYYDVDYGYPVNKDKYIENLNVFQNVR